MKPKNPPGPKSADLSSLPGNPRNPRRISVAARAALKKSLLTFGSLDGFVFNRATGHLIAGHQRQDIFEKGTVEIYERFPQPTPQGTIAHGYITYHGERHPYREVAWPESKEKAALIAANNHGGENTRELLAELLNELATEGADLDLTGLFGDTLAAARKQAYDSLAKLTAIVAADKAAAPPAASGAGDKTSVPSVPSVPSDRHTTLLAFPLTTAEAGRWSEVKKQLAIRDDKLAFLALLTSRLDP